MRKNFFGTYFFERILIHFNFIEYIFKRITLNMIKLGVKNRFNIN